MALEPAVTTGPSDRIGAHSDSAPRAVELPPQLPLVYVPLYRVLKPMFRVYFRMPVAGLEHLPGDGRYLIASNHLSMLDWAFLWYHLPLTTRFLIGRIHDQLPVRIICRLVGPITLSSSGFDMAGSPTAHALLARGGPLIVFPEGGITRTGRPQMGRPGIIRLAAAARVPIVPVALRGADAALPLGRFAPRRRTVAAAFGAPLPPPPDGLGRDQEIGLANRLMEHITALFDGTPPPDGWGALAAADLPRSERTAQPPDGTHG